MARRSCAPRIGGPTSDAVLLGEKLADDLLAQGARDILAATQL